MTEPRYLDDLPAERTDFRVPRSVLRHFGLAFGCRMCGERKVTLLGCWEHLRRVHHILIDDPREAAS